MTIQDLGSLGELLTAIATLITLIYLATQIRQNTKFLRSEAVRDSADQFTNLGLQVASNPEMRAMFVRIRKGEERLEELSDDEQMLVEMLLRSVFNTASKDYTQTLLGVAGEEYWFQVRDFLVFAMFPSKLVLDWWMSQVVPANSYNAEFRAWATSELEKIHSKVGT